MTLKEVKEILNAEVISGDHDLEKEIRCAFAAELLSDVLALAQEGALLITGFTNSQVVYAADLANLSREKNPATKPHDWRTRKRCPFSPPPL
jgi:BioD-like phosphotransacetylase family protein